MSLGNLRRRSVWLRSAAVLVMMTLALVPPVVADAAQAEDGPTDLAISDQIDIELLGDPGVVSTRIDVTTSDGVVTLTGSVNSVLEKERAARTAETVKGVRAVVNRIDVRPSPVRSDEEIKGDVESALLEDPATDSFEIGTTVQDGEVTLTGTVQSYQERRLAGTVARGVRGVTALHDKIEVDYTTDRPDSEIQADIEGSLRWNAYVDNDLVINSTN